MPACGAAQRCRLDVVAAQLGHADPSITLRVYAHVIREQVAEAAASSRERYRPLEGLLLAIR